MRARQAPCTPNSHTHAWAGATRADRGATYSLIVGPLVAAAPPIPEGSVPVPERPVVVLVGFFPVERSAAREGRAAAERPAAGVFPAAVRRPAASRTVRPTVIWTAIIAAAAATTTTTATAAAAATTTTTTTTSVMTFVVNCDFNQENKMFR